MGCLLSNPILSVVVPIYKVERYLPKCLDSILAQTLKGIEIICVDDGSPDCSGEIAESYARKHASVKVIHQMNSGLGPARNTGIEHATGDFIAFVDSDDWLEPDMYELMYRKAVETGADIVVGGHCDSSENKILCTKKHPLAGTIACDRSQIEPIRLRLYGHAEDDDLTESFPMAVWASIYRRSLIVNNQLRFKAILSEDTIFNLSAYAKSRAIAFTDIVGYRYRKEGQASITSSLSPDLINRYERFVDELCAMAKKEDIFEDVKMRIARTAIDCIRLCAGIIASSNLSYKEKNCWLNELMKSPLQLEYASTLPIEYLPLQQRLFENLLVGEHYRCCIYLLKLREWVKNFRYWKERG